MPARLYLKPEELAKHSGLHTHYSGDGAVRTNTNDPVRPLHRLTFYGGVATNVPDELAKRMEDEGIATRNRPKRREDDL